MAGLSFRDLLRPSLSDTGVLDVTGVRFYVSGARWLCEGDSVRFGSSLMMSDDTGDRDWFPLTTAARSRDGGSGRCGWLQFVPQGAGPVSPPINEHSRTVVLNRKGGVVYVRIVHMQRESVGSPAGDRVTASISSSMLLYCAALPFVL